MITTIQGHLTATNKAHLNEMMRKGITSAKVNRIEYHIYEQPNGEYNCNIIKRDRGLGWIGNEVQTSTYKVRFKYK